MTFMIPYPRFMGRRCVGECQPSEVSKEEHHEGIMLSWDKIFYQRSYESDPRERKHSLELGMIVVDEGFLDSPLVLTFE